VLFAKTYGRVLCPGFVTLDLAMDPALGKRHPLHLAWRNLNSTLDDFLDRQMLAAA